MRGAAIGLSAVALCGCGSESELLGAVQSDAGLVGADATIADGSGPWNLPYVLGADISWTQQDQANGATYLDDDGGQRPLLALLKDHGFNFIRLRTFVDPTQAAPNPEGGAFAPYSTAGYCDLAHTITFGQAIKAASLGFLLDFHYSDYWADPGKQIKPAAWAADDLPTMTAAVRSYTADAIRQLVAGGARPDIVQTGNDITPGLELTPGTPMGPTSNWPALAQLLKAGIEGVHSVDPTIKIMLHIDRGGDPAASIAWVSAALDSGVSFDVLGESCYLAYQGPPSGWQATFSALSAAFPTLKFAIAQYSGDPNSTAEVRSANDFIFNLPRGQGLGTFFWEPTHSGVWGTGLFTVSGAQYATVPASIDQFDQMKAAYGL